MYPRHSLRSGNALRIVAIGGGTGLSTLLHGLKTRKLFAGPSGPPADLDITAVVTVSDDGGSSGRLRRDFDVLPPGDIRNCLVALSREEALLSKLFQYRFTSGRGLKGHSLGNLFLTALADLSGDFAQGVQHASDVLATCGRIFPATSQSVILEAVLQNGTVVQGETKISKSKVRIERIRLNPASVQPMPQTLNAICEADLITLGPGSLFTSVIPNLLVNGIAEAIASSRARKLYFVNLMWQPGETIQFTAADHVQAIHEHAGTKLIDVAVVNRKTLPTIARQRYAAKRALPVENDIDRLLSMDLQVLVRDLAADGDKIRHDPAELADIVIRLGTEIQSKRAFKAITA